MSREAWGDEGDIMPEGCVSEDSYQELQEAHDEFRDACALMYLACSDIMDRDAWDPVRIRAAMNTGLKALKDHTPGGFEVRPT